MTVKLRYKAPAADRSVALEVPVSAGTQATSNLGFAAAVAEFGMLLRDSPFKGEASWRQAAALAKLHRGVDQDGYRAELIRLIDAAASLKRRDARGTR